MHNHKIKQKLEGRILVGCLNAKEAKLVGDMTRNLVKPKNNLLNVKNRQKDNLTIANKIYNARHRYKHTIIGSGTEMQRLLKCLEDNTYVFKYRTVSGSKIVQIYFGHILNMCNYLTLFLQVC